MHKYVADVAPVRELALLGSADLSYWRERLKPFELFPAARNNRALIQIEAMEARFMGLAFREFSAFVFTGQSTDVSAPDGVFLPQAFNSRRSFAWIERTLFRTPYYPGRIELSVTQPASARLIVAGDPVASAWMGTTETRKPANITQVAWEGPIYLPHMKSGTPGPLKMFFASIAGTTNWYPFDASADRLELTPSSRAPLISELINADFVPEQWIIRTDARHKRSKTVFRN